MDKMFIVCILITHLGSASMTAFQDALTNIDGHCEKNSLPVTAPCSAEKLAVETPSQNNDFAGACANLQAYTACLDTDCDQDADLKTLKDTMDTTCALSSDVKDFLGVLNMIDNQCTTSASDPCATEMNDMDTQLQADSLPEACKKLPGYKICLLSDCDPSAVLRNSISTMENKCGMSPNVTDLLGVLSIINNQCTKNSGLVQNPCPVEKNEVDTPLQLQSKNLTEACKKLPGYKMCLLSDCDPIQDLRDSIRMMENTCGMNPSVTDLLGVLGKIDDECKNGATLVQTPCSAEKNSVNTELSGNSLTEACKKLSAYKTCLGQKCDTSDHLDEFISKMDDSCSSGFMKISVSVLALFLAAIVNFL